MARQCVFVFPQVGITLAAILSHRFEVECRDPVAKLHLTQYCEDHMATVHAPVLRKLLKKDGNAFTTAVRFQPDLSRFAGIDSLLTLLPSVRTRLTQLSATLGGRVRFVFNGDAIRVDSFKKYMGLYGFEKSLFEVLSPTFEYGFALSGTGEFQHDSFVNNLATTEGGTHVNIVTSQIVAVIAGYFETKFKKSNAKLSKASIKNKLHVFVNIRVTNPEFRSQASRFGLVCALPPSPF